MNSSISSGNWSIITAFSNKSDGDMRQQENISRFLLSNGFNNSLYICGRQIHSTQISMVGNKNKGMVISDTDGLIASIDTSEDENLVLGIITADCVPLLFYDSVAGVIAAVHSGWKGTLGNIASECVDSMISAGSSVENIFVILGPHIRSCCYSIPHERSILFIEKYGSKSISIQNNMHFLDMSYVINSQLTSRGVPHSQIYISQECTSTLNETYFSFRKDSKQHFGEQISIIGLKKVK